MERIETCVYRCACGNLLLGSFAGELVLCDWTEAAHHERVLRRVERVCCARLSAPAEMNCLLVAASEVLDAYFLSGDTVQLGRMPLRFCGTDFQVMVWRALREIAPGQTLTYGELARRVGCPGGVRAVASAVGANAMSIFIPCHRIVGAGGTLGGYAGGPSAKEFLLRHESGWGLSGLFPGRFGKIISES